MGDQPSKIFDRYEIVELIAIGGMAQVFRARLLSPQGTSKPVVVKKLLPHLADNREFLDMFIDEARISMPLSHANIVQVFDFVQVENDYFMVMEYVHGFNLESILQNCREAKLALPIPMGLFIASEVAKGLDYAHRYTNTQRQPTGIIHRDISPQNILIGLDGSVKLTDFGIAKAKSRIHQTRHGIIRGKACYLSPEQAECGELDGRSDQFSLAVVLFELLTGVRPFEGETELATLNNVRNIRPNAPSMFRAEIPDHLDRIILKALSRNPSDRYDNAGIFQSQLAQALRALEPDYSSTTLAGWLDRTSILKNHPDGRAAQIESKPNLSREEILKMKTVIIAKGSPKSKKKKSSGPIIVAVSLSILIAIVIGAWLGNWTISLDSWFNRNEIQDSDKTPGPSEAIQGSKPTDPPKKPQDDSQPQTTPTLANNPPPSSKKVEPVRYGTLHLNADPWALVEIDGKRLDRHTPLFNVRVRAGRHNLRFFNPEIKLEKTITVWVFPERTKTVSIRLIDP